MKPAPLNPEIRKVAVIGAGLMGHGIALEFARGGHDVSLFDVSPDALASALQLIDAALRTLEDAGFSAADEHDEILAHIAPTASVKSAVAGADLVIEAVTEDPKIKRQVFAQLDVYTSRRALFASNTSSLNVFPLIPANRQARSLILHWYTPPYIVDLVDVVPGPRTRADVVEQCRGLLEKLNKKPIVLKKFVAGFIANRLQAALNLEVFSLLDQGLATPEQIDAAIITGLALRMPLLGHLKKADYTGLKLVQKLLAARSYRPPKVTGRCRALDRRIAAGETGVMAGRGFYDYGGRSARDLFRERDRKLLALKKFLNELGGLE